MKATTILQLLGLGLSAQPTLAVPINPPATAPDLTSRELAAGIQQEPQQESFLNCSGGYTTWCIQMGTYCDGDTHPYSYNAWCALNCECYYYQGCCTVTGFHGKDGEGEAASKDDAPSKLDVALHGTGNTETAGAEKVGTTQVAEAADAAPIDAHATPPDLTSRNVATEKVFDIECTSGLTEYCRKAGSFCTDGAHPASNDPFCERYCDCLYPRDCFGDGRLGFC
ncbi:hypothetical protein N657DRAFT_686975 [Parathielavia appendiculata]|uniref:Uncharacterized protein n=1 Tax=Parathielavia appendiculata TaxID=2587402 RepID=A0AAN6Z9L4_9PEZI|nr:hypothetical protein N657DRAFT_686975 [Parathielavia appendiculata]